MLNNIEVLFHSSIRITENKVIYFDPYNIDKNYNDADIVFITHDHYEHYSKEDIEKVKTEKTIFVIPKEKHGSYIIHSDKILLGDEQID